MNIPEEVLDTATEAWWRDYTDEDNLDGMSAASAITLREAMEAAAPIIAEWARKEARDQLLGELRWLAAARAEYCHLSHTDVRAYLGASELEKHLHQEHATAEGLADIIEGTNDGMGWLPSWRWDDWAELRSGTEGNRP